METEKECSFRREEGHELNSVAVEVTVPGATQVRSVAMWHHMRRTHPHAMRGPNIYDDVTDLKEALRLALGTPLGAALGVAVAQVRTFDGPRFNSLPRRCLVICTLFFLGRALQGVHVPRHLD
jgi:hypothetical protein